MTLRRCIYAICQHPEVEARVAAELAAAGLLATPERPQPRSMEHADLARLTYLQCVIKVGSFMQFVACLPVAHSSARLCSHGTCPCVVQCSGLCCMPYLAPQLCVA